MYDSIQPPIESTNYRVEPDQSQISKIYKKTLKFCKSKFPKGMRETPDISIRKYINKPN